MNELIIKDILTRELDFDSGTKFQYSDLGMILLMDIIEKVTGSSLDDISNNWIYKRL